jgi:hypothetical protein
MSHIPGALRWICRHDSFSVEGCLYCEAADEIERLQAHPTAPVQPQSVQQGGLSPQDAESGPGYSDKAYIADLKYELNRRSALARTPLSEEQIDKIIRATEFPAGSLSTLSEQTMTAITTIIVRAVERAQGITAEHETEESLAGAQSNWTVTGPDGRQWTGESPVRACAAAQRDTIDPVLAMKRINAVVDEENAIRDAELEAAREEGRQEVRGFLARGIDSGSTPKGQEPGGEGTRPEAVSQGIPQGVEARLIKRLKEAVEGECDGLGLTDDHARAILEYVLQGEQKL